MLRTSQKASAATLIIRYTRRGKQGMNRLLAKLLGRSEPEDASAACWLDKGTSLAALGRHEEAIECYNKALLIDGRSADVWFEKAVSLVALNRREDALVCYNRSIAL